MNRGGHVFYEIWIGLAAAMVCFAIGIPSLARHQYLVGIPTVAAGVGILGFMVYARFRS